MLRAAEAASEWAGEAPLLFGGDLNLRPAESPEVFAELARALRPGGADRPATRSTTCWRAGSSRSSHRGSGRPSGARSSDEGLALRLSDHAPVEARFATPP